MHVLAFANAGVPVQRGRGVLGNLVENGEKRLLLEQKGEINKRKSNFIEFHPNLAKFD